MTIRYILDTNVLLHDPTAIYHFLENDVVIPLRVLEEIDRFKKDGSELGRNARYVSRTLDGLRKKGKLSDGVKLDNGGSLRIMFINTDDLFSNKLPVDDYILKLASQMMIEDSSRPCILVSKDINLRLRADALGIIAEDYVTGQVDISEMFIGHGGLTVDGDILDELNEKRVAKVENLEVSPNQYFLVKDQDDESRTILARYDLKEDALLALGKPPEELSPIQPRNKEQYYALDALLNDDIKIVTITGKAGTGKTLLAVAAALYKTFDKKIYKRMLICRPTIPMGRDIGYLPGTLEEKLNPWMQPIYDALDLVANGKHPGLKKTKNGYEETEKLHIEPLTYIRGRSIPRQFIVVDEAQNLTPREVKTVLTRVGHGTKIVLTGDIYQIDNPYVDSMSNGLSSIVESFRPYALSAHIVLSKGVRSELAELAANLL